MGMLCASVVPCGNKVGSLGECTLGEGAKFNGLVAHNVGIGRESLAIRIDEVVDNGCLVVGLAVPYVERNP